MIAPVYDVLTSFDHGLAQVLVGDRLGVIDKDGRWVVPAEHGLIARISDDVFLVAEPPYSKPARLLRPLGEHFSRPLPRAFPHADGKRWGIVGRGGAWIVRPTFTQVMAFSDEPDGLFWAADAAGTSARWKLMRADGTAVSDDVFDHVQPIQPGEDRAVVQRGGRWGAVDGRGRIAVELQFDWLGFFRDGWAPYRLGGREGRIDRDGKIIAGAGVSLPSFPPADSRLGATVDGKALCTDRAGTTLLGTDQPRCPDGRHLRFAQGRWTIVSADEQPAPDIAFQYVHLACTGPSVVGRDGKWGFVSRDGRLLANRYFDRVNAFHDGIAAVTDQGLWAVIGDDGSFLLGPLRLARGMVLYGAGGEYRLEFEEGYRKPDRALVAELARDPDILTHRLVPRMAMSEGLAALFDDKTARWGFVDAGGKFLIAPHFDAVTSFSKGYAWVAVPERRQWCQIDKAGHVKEETACRCWQPLVIVEHYRRPPDLDCYDGGLRIVREVPVDRGPAP